MICFSFSGSRACLPIMSAQQQQQGWRLQSKAHSVQQQQWRSSSKEVHMHHLLQQQPYLEGLLFCYLVM